MKELDDLERDFSCFPDTQYQTKRGGQYMKQPPYAAIRKSRNIYTAKKSIEKEKKNEARHPLGE